MSLLLALVFGLVSGQVKAQVDIGFRSGPTFNNISQTNTLDAITPDFDYLIGFSGAVYAEVPISNELSFQAELAYAQKGFSLRQATDVDLFGVALPIGVTADSRFSYLDLPLLLKASFGSESVKAFVMAGPSLGYALNGRLKTRSNGLLDINISNSEINLDAINYERFEVSGVVGAGLSFDAGFGQITLDGRFQQGFTELYDIPLLSERVKNKGFAINAGVAIPIN